MCSLVEWDINVTTHVYGTVETSRARACVCACGHVCVGGARCETKKFVSEESGINIY
jgi:hypothetical protein